MPFSRFDGAAEPGGTPLALDMERDPDLGAYLGLGRGWGCWPGGDRCLGLDRNARLVLAADLCLDLNQNRDLDGDSELNRDLSREQDQDHDHDEDQDQDQDQDQD